MEEKCLVEECQEAQAAEHPSLFSVHRCVWPPVPSVATSAFKLDVYKSGQAGLYLFKKLPFAKEIPICRGDSLQVDFTENDSIGQFSPPLPKAATAP